MQTDNTADADDASIPLVHHKAAGRFGAEKCPLQVGGKHIVKISFGHPQKQFVGGNARVVDQHIDPPKSGYSIFYQLLTCFGAAHVRLQRDSLHAKGAAGCGCFLGSGSAAGIVDGNVHAVFGQSPANGTANAFGPARNQSGTAQVFGLRHGQAPFMVRSSCCSCAAVSTG